MFEKEERPDRVIGIIGENCSGKSTLANEIRKEFDSGIYDYRIDGVNGDAASLCAELRTRC